jgi:hypothetical protein
MLNISAITRMNVINILYSTEMNLSIKIEFDLRRENKRLSGIQKVSFLSRKFLLLQFHERRTNIGSRITNNFLRVAKFPHSAHTRSHNMMITQGW